MDVASFVDGLRRNGGELWVEDGRVRFRGPRGLFDERCLALLKGHKREIIEFLQRGPRSGSAITARARGAPSRPEISILFFASKESRLDRDKYRLFLDAVKKADRAGLDGVWVPERHFHRFGGLYPSPAVLGGAIAAVTQNIRIRAGSIVLPLNNPIRVAEEWSVVDNLSGGRVDLAFAQGWNAKDFVLAPANFSNRLQVLLDGVETVDRLWRGEQIERPDGDGKSIAVGLFPAPLQKKLNKWLTCSTGDVERFREAGRRGMNVLTALLFQTKAELQQKIDAYRQHYDAGGGRGEGIVTLMLHTFIGSSHRAVKDTIRVPFTEYLRDSIDLWRYQMEKIDSISEAEEAKVLQVAFERYVETAGLFGTPDDCAAKVAGYAEMGVGEIACLVDFGVDYDGVMSCVDNIVALRARLRGESPALDGERSRSVQESPG